MKSKIIFGLIVASVVLFSSCDNDSIRASGEVTSRDFSLAGYSALEVGGAFEVFVQFSATEERVVIEANENLQDRLVVQVVGNTLQIRPENNLSIRGNATLRALITTSDLSNINLSGATTLRLDDPWIVTNGGIGMSGASDITGEIQAQQMDIRASGSSDIDFFGAVEDLRVDLSGSSDLKDFDLVVQRLDMNLSGSSDAFLTVDESVEIDASGSSSLTLRGNADIVRQSLSGGSEINRIN